VADGSVKGEHAPTWKNKLREAFIWKVLGIWPELPHGGGNYHAVADRVMRRLNFEDVKIDAHDLFDAQAVRE
jgi:hypothetical protein